MSSSTRWILATLSTALGIVLIWLVFDFVPGIAGLFGSTLRSVKPQWALLVLMITLVNLWVAAIKWKLIAEHHTQSRHLSTSFYLFYVAVGTLSGHVLPRPVGAVAVRSLALKRGGQVTLRRGLFTVIYDVSFDMLIPFLLLVPSVLFFLQLISPTQIALLSTAVLLIVGATIGAWHGSLIRLMARTYTSLRRTLRHENQVAGEDMEIGTPPGLTPGHTRLLFVLAVLRYANMILRSFVVTQLGDLAIPFSSIAVSYPLIQLAFLASVTPAGLGIVEWGWIGVLEQFQVPSPVAGTFALLQRVLVLASVAMVALGTAFFYRGTSKGQNQ